MIAKLYLNESEVASYSVRKIRNELHLGLLIASLLFEEDAYVAPLPAENSYVLKYFKDDGTLIQTFSEVHFRSFESYPATEFNSTTGELKFLVNRI